MASPPSTSPPRGPPRRPGVVPHETVPPPPPAVDLMPSAALVDADAEWSAASEPHGDLTEQLLDAGALDRGDDGGLSIAPSLPSVPLALLDGAGDTPHDESAEGSALQSESMSQLKGMMGGIVRAKQQQYSYRHEDADTTTCELEEFFSYVEVPGVVAEGRGSWERAWRPAHDGEWPDAAEATRRVFLQRTLEQLEHRDNERRFEAARRLAYVAQGTPVYGTSQPDHLLRLIITNCTSLRAAGALQGVYEALKNAGGRWASMATMSDNDFMGQGWPTQQERQEYLEEINGELAILLSILYFMVEAFRGDDVWAEELMALDPPLPFYLVSVVASLRERNAKGYPVKKLLLLLWKSLLAALGGAQDIHRVKTLVREIEGLPLDAQADRHRLVTKVSPSDFQSFRQEITSKYPSYCPPAVETPIHSISLESIAASSAPAPLRPLFPYHQPHIVSPTNPMADHLQNPQAAGGPQPATPAPTPPPSPKPKKQQYQTDQSRPFVLPFSRVTAGARVPRSINEAGMLYTQHVRLSTELWQTTKIREECVADESGLAYAASKGARGHDTEGLPNGDVHVNGDVGEQPLPDSLQMLQTYLATIEHQAQEAQEEGVRKQLEQRAVDLRRLVRVELLYRTALPHLQPAVVVLLKLLLATVTANSGLAALPSVTDEETAPPVLNVEDTDIMRHREITSKAVSAILILLLRWFKTSHVMKFQYFSQLIVDSNGLLLVLKMFGSQEMSTLVKMRNEVEESNFFRYCCLHGCGKPAVQRPEDTLPNEQPAPKVTTADAANGVTESEDMELITDFSWRNFFATTNFVHILQKLTKRKVHRILLLTQYKAQAILKRMLKISQPLLQLYLLKLIKSQVPYSGRKWRQSNMKVITSIYLNCRPDLRDEWLTGMDVDADIEDSLPHEQALRALVKFYNTKHYGLFAPHLHRPTSNPQFMNSPAAAAFGDGPAPLPQPSPSIHHADESFPPARSASHYTRDAFARSTAYGGDSDGYLEDYEEILGDLLTPRYTVDAKGVPSLYPDGSGAQSETAWHRLGEILGEEDDISDSESVASIGFLGFGDTEGGESGAEDGEAEGRPKWAEMSPQSINALEEERMMQQSEALGSPRSPRPRRASSGPKSPALRPVMPNYDHDDSNEEAVEFEAEKGPAKSAPHLGPAVDEVEAVFGE